MWCATAAGKGIEKITIPIPTNALWVGQNVLGQVSRSVRTPIPAMHTRSLEGRARLALATFLLYALGRDDEIRTDTKSHLQRELNKKTQNIFAIRDILQIGRA